MECIHGVQTKSTHIEHMHRVHTWSAYMEDTHGSLQYFRCLPAQNRSSGDVISISGILSMSSIILDGFQGGTSFWVITSPGLKFEKGKQSYGTKTFKLILTSATPCKRMRWFQIRSSFGLTLSSMMSPW